jgi:hypothetical protein
MSKLPSLGHSSKDATCAAVDITATDVAVPSPDASTTMPPVEDMLRPAVNNIDPPAPQAPQVPLPTVRFTRKVTIAT